MEQYLQLLKDIKEKGTYKAPARENMPGTTSLFGYQFRHDLKDGFPLLTTKKIYWRGVVTELLWFLRGDSNIKYLVENGCNFWIEDSFNFYKKKGGLLSFEEFKLSLGKRCSVSGITLGDTGKQYPWLWRKWGTFEYDDWSNWKAPWQPGKSIDQIKELIEGLNNNPSGRRHIITAWNPATLNDMALPACHSFVQFNTRLLTFNERWVYVKDQGMADSMLNGAGCTFDTYNIPKYKLDCKFTMRSCDVFLGLPVNIASYATLTHLIATICNMEVGDLIVDLGDVHIYDNHIEQVNEQLNRTPTELPELRVLERHPDHDTIPDHFEKYLVGRYSLDDFLQSLTQYDFRLIGYKPQGTIKGELSTGLIKQ